MIQPRAIKEYEVTYLDHEGLSHTVVDVYARDAFHARSVCVELVGEKHITKVMPPRLIPDFDF